MDKEKIKDLLDIAKDIETLNRGIADLFGDNVDMFDGVLSDLANHIVGDYGLENNPLVDRDVCMSAVFEFSRKEITKKECIKIIKEEVKKNK